MNSPVVPADKPGQHFDWWEFEVTSTGLPNALPAAARPHIRYLVFHLLDPLLEALGRPVVITSGYRSPAVNRAVKGSPTSRHPLGQAADFWVPPTRRQPALTSFEVARRILDLGLPFDQLIAYAPKRGGHNHVGLHGPDVGPLRRDIRMAPDEGGMRKWTP